MTSKGHLVDEIEKSLSREMAKICERSKREAGYNPTYFMRVLAEHGPIDTARRLAGCLTVSDGFTALWERSRLDLTVEALILREKYRDLFDDDPLESAEHRLNEYGYRAASARVDRQQGDRRSSS